MGRTAIILTYGIFFFSGASALIYEIVWARYLSLVFGGSHLAVSTVLTIFMAGLAFGSYFIGRSIDSRKKLLRLYGFLELGIGGSALLFIGLLKIYPPVYIFLAQFAPESTLYLSCIRIAFAFLALIVPTTLMGGTLPVLTGFTSRLMQGTATRLSFLYGCNTLGAVIGAAATGFVMLRSFSMGKTLITAMAINICAGLAALYLQQRVGPEPEAELLPEQDTAQCDHPDTVTYLFPFRLVIWGIGVSGFCAMGYEVLWNRILSIIIGASAYGFTLLLMAFLSGIGMGSAAYGIYCRIRGKQPRESLASLSGAIISFGWVQVIIGGTALLATAQFRHLPAYVAFLHDYFLNNYPQSNQFELMQLANFILAFSIMFVPAFFMGLAFPLAGAIHCSYRRLVGSAVGELLLHNTVGAILGASVSGYLLIYLFGIQRSLQLIILMNIGFGLLVIASVRSGRTVTRLTAAVAVAFLMVPVFFPNSWRMWNPDMYAIYQSNKPEEYRSSEDMKELLANMNIRYYAEGAQSIVSAIQSADILFFITNGRVEASNAHQDMQCQYVLGHLPMLLHKNPRSVFVLGTGSGMTLGATSVHPSVERITLAEIEPKVLGVAKTFGINNHYILNKPDPRLKIIFNDGRNYLLTTKDKFDVITADPVHPWFSGAGYLYSTEYFQLAASKLNPGGILCQWLPLYELTGDNLKSVVRTIRENFAYTMIWVTHYDAEIIASNSPIIIDELDLERRIAVPQIREDLHQVKMGTALDLLSYFVMGSTGTAAYSHDGRINTDDNLYLEFSAPQSIGMEFLRGGNLAYLLQYRENLTPYLRKATDPLAWEQQSKRWDNNYQAALLADKAHFLGVTGQYLSYEYTDIATELEDRYPHYAPWQFTKEMSSDERGGDSKILKELELTLLDDQGTPFKAQFMAILVSKNNRWSRIFFVDDTTRTVFGKLRVRRDNLNGEVEAFVTKVMQKTEAIYTTEAAKTAATGNSVPSLLKVFPMIKTMVEASIEDE
jgi:spermidine synthase